MKTRLILLLTLISTTCTPKTYTTVYYSRNIDKCIENLETMQRWLVEDYKNGQIPYHVANNYMIVLINTKCGLKKRNKTINDVDCVD
jgi:hypothetical protein